MVGARRPSVGQSGFTLMEIIITVAIAGILAGVALASFNSSYENERLRSGSKVLAAWIDEQRKKAIQNSSACTVSVEVDGGEVDKLSSQCSFESSVGDEFDPQSYIIADNDLSLTQISGSSSWVFTPRGTTTADTDEPPEFRLTLANSNALGRCIRILAPLGLVRLARLTSENECDYTTAY